MENKVVDILTELGIKINILANKGQELPDIATPQFNIEIEKPAYASKSITIDIDIAMKMAIK